MCSCLGIGFVTGAGWGTGAVQWEEGNVRVKLTSATGNESRETASAVHLCTYKA